MRLSGHAFAVGRSERGTAGTRESRRRKISLARDGLRRHADTEDSPPGDAAGAGPLRPLRLRTPALSDVRAEEQAGEDRGLVLFRLWNRKDSHPEGGQGDPGRRVPWVREPEGSRIR